MMITASIGPVLREPSGQPARYECDTTIARNFAAELLQMAEKVTNYSM
jgi:hypothetical protein